MLRCYICERCKQEYIDESRKKNATNLCPECEIEVDDFGETIEDKDEFEIDI